MQIAYVALDEQGRQVQGGLEAPDPAGAAAVLRRQGLFPVELAAGRASAPPAGATPAGSWPSFVGTSDVVLFLGQLGLMLRTGLGLLPSLETLGRAALKPGLRRAATRIGAAVSAGRALSVALEAEGRLFPPVVVQLVRMAEATGELEQALRSAAEHLDQRAQLRAQLVTSLLYPAVVVVMASGVFWFLTTRLIPKLAAFLSRRAASLPWTTQRLMDVSAFMQAWGAPIGVGLVLAAVLAALARRTPSGRGATDRLVLRLPIVGGVLRIAAQAHLARTLGLLLRCGLPLVESLRVLALSFSSPVWSGLVLRARERVVLGASLATGLEDPLLSPLVTQVVRVGEQSGALDEVLGELGDFEDRALRQRVKTLSALVEPAILVVVGGLVGFVYVSFFQAIFALSGAR